MVVTLNHKIIPLLSYNCDLATVINHNGNIIKMMCRLSDRRRPQKGHVTSKGVVTRRLKSADGRFVSVTENFSNQKTDSQLHPYSYPTSGTR